MVLDVVSDPCLREDQAGVVGRSPSLQTAAWGVTPPRVTWVSSRHSGDRAGAVTHSLSAFKGKAFRVAHLSRSLNNLALSRRPWKPTPLMAGFQTGSQAESLWSLTPDTSSALGIGSSGSRDEWR